MNRNTFNKKLTSNTIFLILFSLMVLGPWPNKVLGQDANWTVPESANKIENPHKGFEKSTLAGEFL